MKKHLTTIILLAVLVVGLSIMLYPTVSDYWNSFHQSRAIADYNTKIENMSEEEYARMFAEADEYNRKIKALNFPFTEYSKVSGYENTLSITDSGIMGYISIPRIGVELPIYHTTKESVLQVAVGHLEGTTLPTGGEGMHCVLSGHRGLPSARLFTDLDKMEVGDIFSMTVLDRMITYEVDQILTVLPSEISALYPVDGEDYCTLVTCTPYGINSHRLLVRGKRTDNPEIIAEAHVTADAAQVEPLLAACFFAVPMLIIFFVSVMIPKKKPYKKDEKED